jgi:hypothetical protein
MAFYYARAPLVGVCKALDIEPREYERPRRTSWPSGEVDRLISVKRCLEELPDRHMKTVEMLYTLPDDDPALRAQGFGDRRRTAMSRLARIMTERNVLR